MYIGTRAFSNNSLVTLEIPDNVDNIRDEAFSKNFLKNVILPNDLYYCNEISAFMRNSGNTFNDYEYVLINDKVMITNYTGKGGEIEIPLTIEGYSVAFIGNIAFRNKLITKVTIPCNCIYKLSGGVDSSFDYDVEIVQDCP